MNNVLFRLAAGLESWGKGEQRGKQGFITLGDRSETSTFLFFTRSTKMQHFVLMAVIPFLPETFLVPLRKAVGEEVKTHQAAAARVMASWLYPKV